MIDRLILSRLESLYESSKSSEGGQGRDFSFRFATVKDSLYLASRLVGWWFYSEVGASGGKTVISRIKVVRPPPAAPYGLAPYGICDQFPHPLRGSENCPQTP